ncbi:hypothetical protein LAD74_00885 [Mycoplasma sp. U97]|uniref:HinT-interacting membrane complex lipoprotein P60 n=1 Tax=Mycoplasma tauri TaxID=547987 RepID=UPI001CC10C49|nr:hypothetical protein [Mycoplasma tauri]MBZ4212554.1 hypothetical protein [Mycoplasma tauri]
MKRNKLLLNILPLTFVGSLPVLSLSCNANKINTTEKLEQNKQLGDKKNIEKLKKVWKIHTLSKLYGINVEKDSVNPEELKNIFKEEFKKKQSKLFKDSYEAYKIYAQSESNNKELYFTEKIAQWNRDNAFKNEKFSWDESTEAFPGEKNQDIFVKIWLAEDTEISSKINDMLLVKAYFTLSNINDFMKIKNSIEKEKLKNKKEQVKEVNFEYYLNDDKATKDSHYDLKNYFLIKYAIENKYIQLWNKSLDRSSGFKDQYDKFTNPKHASKISTPEDFNNFFKDDDVQANKKIKDWEIVSNQSEVEKQLSGYTGFKKTSQNESYGLNWDIDVNKARESFGQSYGVYSSQNQMLFNFDSLKKGDIKSFVYVSEQDKHVSYVNQIVPIGKETKLLTKKDFGNKVLTSEDYEKLLSEKGKKARVLSFENTIYKGNEDKLAYMFYAKDSNKLLDEAIKTFAHLGHKLKVNKDIEPLYNLTKDIIWIES